MVRGILIFGAGFALMVTAGWMNLPRGLYKEEAQPFAFSHLAHTSEKKGAMACADCHSLRADGSFAGIPKLETCVGCHTEPAGESKVERAFIEQYVKPGREPQWRVYSRQPDNAWFPHATHINLAKVKCERCHGDHGQSATLAPVRVNRISGYSQTVMNTMRMDDCVACHQENRLKHSCLDCHR